MRRECREHFPRHRFQRKPLVSDPDMHHGTCVTYVPWFMSGSLTRGSGENVPGIPGACATFNFAYLVRVPLHILHIYVGTTSNVWHIIVICKYVLQKFCILQLLSLHFVMLLFRKSFHIKIHFLESYVLKICSNYSSVKQKVLKCIHLILFSRWVWQWSTSTHTYVVYWFPIKRAIFQQAI